MCILMRKASSNFSFAEKQYLSILSFQKLQKFLKGALLNEWDKRFIPCDMIVVPSDKAGPDNDLADFFKKRIDTEECKKNANIYVYGGYFDTGLGLHEVHMNQGSIERFEDSNGVYQDGCILLEYPGDHWEAIFLAFQSQSWCTDNKTGMSTKKCFVYDHKTNEKICDIERRNLVLK